jgi:Zn-dependent M28 family amino/carboxypeptidase
MNLHRAAGGGGQWASLGLAMALVAAGTSGVAQQPQRLLDAAGHVRDDAFIRMPLGPEDQKYADIDGARMKAIVREVSQISLKTRDDRTRYWGRIAGTSGEAMTTDWVEGRFKAAGLVNIHRQDFPLPPQWFPKEWAISFASGGGTHTFKSVLPALRSSATPAAGLDLDVVWVGTGTAADFAGRDVKGKAVLIHSIPAPGSMGHSATYEGAIVRAHERGAAAIGVIYGISDNFAIWQGLGAYGTAERRTPVSTPGFFMGWEDGKVIRDLLGEGKPVRLSMRVAVEERPGLKSQSVVGTLPGATDEEIIVMAHMDGYFEAALDNASGLSVMMTLVDHFAKVPQSERRRAIRFIGTAGHHVGSPGARWLHDNRATTLAKTALMINCEHISVPDHKYWGPALRKSTVIAPRRWWVHGSGRLLDIVLKSYATFNVGIIADMDPGSSGEMSVVARDAPSLQVIRSPVTKHTDVDIPEWVPAVGLEQVGRAYAKIIDEVNKLDRRDILPAPTTSTAAR